MSIKRIPSFRVGILVTVKFKVLELLVVRIN